MNIWDILILLVIAGTACFAFFRARKRKAEGKSSCCGSCGNCSLCSQSVCQKKTEHSL